VFAKARLEASANGVSISATDLDRYASGTVADAVVEDVGAAMLSTPALTGIAEGFAKDATLTMIVEEKIVSVQCGRSRYQLPIWPIAECPLPLTIDAPACSLTLSRAEAWSLLEDTAFAASTDVTRNCLNGTYLHEHDGAFVACATDCRRLALRTLPMPKHAGTWPGNGIIVPNKTIKIINALIKNAAEIEITVGAPATARGAATLIAASASGHRLTSKLINDTFPNYRQFIPAPSKNSALIGRADLVGAVNRAAAVSTDQGLSLGIAWSKGDKHVQVCLSRAVDVASDEVAAETYGAARVALSARLLLDQLDEIASKIVRLDPGNETGTPVLISDPADSSFLSLLMPMAWLAPAAERKPALAREEHGA
jgi:DNA polymerase-3 subunit beta